jgi:hypothetical protein
MKDDKTYLTPPRLFSLEEAISYIAGAPPPGRVVALARSVDDSG